MSVPYEKWIVDLKNLAEKVPAEAMSTVVRKISFEALGQLVLRSPVGNPSLWKSKAPPGYVGGHFRNNWFIDINTVDPQTRQSINKSGSDSMAESKKLEVISSNPYVTVYIHNSLPYASRLENGWSSQAPTGMVALTAHAIGSAMK